MPASKMSNGPDVERQIKFSTVPAWEEITWSTYRLQVPGGWLYRYERGYEVAMCFLPGAGE